MAYRNNSEAIKIKAHKSSFVNLDYFQLQNLPRKLEPLPRRPGQLPPLENAPPVKKITEEQLKQNLKKVSQNNLENLTTYILIQMRFISHIYKQFSLLHFCRLLQFEQERLAKEREEIMKPKTEVG